MLRRETLSREHDELDFLASEILSLIDAPEPNFQALSRLRWRMNRVLLIHLAKEDKHLYPELLRSPRNDVSALASQFAKEMGSLAGLFTDYITDWPISRAVDDWPGFAIATRVILTALRDRIRREEQELYPFLT